MAGWNGGHQPEQMITLRIENTVHDYDTWKLAFDRYDRARRDHGVLGYRVTRAADDPRRVGVDLDFATLDAAQTFRGVLERIWATPQSQRALAGHMEPTTLEVVELASLTTAG